jgi:hypothetical protein
MRGLQVSGLLQLRSHSTGWAGAAINCHLDNTTQSPVSRTENIYNTQLPVVARSTWEAAAKQHETAMFDLLYPPGKTLKARRHSVRAHPVYNFLHQYYRFSPAALLKYSPGPNIILSDSFHAEDQASSLLNSDFRCISYLHDGFYYSPFLLRGTDGRDAIKKHNGSGRTLLDELVRCRQLLQRSLERRPLLSCFGLHEWAMLYWPATQDRLRPKQENLPLRVSQDVINATVDANPLRCTHFDAWRFFHPSTQPRNVIPTLSRESQLQHEQPGCIHNTMDLFRIAHLAYPLISSKLLIEALEIAISARKIDMRSSPYDLSTVAGCENVIAVETPEGRRLMMQEQEKLYLDSIDIRKNLLLALDEILSQTDRSVAAASLP